MSIAWRYCNRNANVDLVDAAAYVRCREYLSREAIDEDFGRNRGYRLMFKWLAETRAVDTYEVSCDWGFTPDRMALAYSEINCSREHERCRPGLRTVDRKHSWRYFLHYCC